MLTDTPLLFEQSKKNRKGFKIPYSLINDIPLDTFLSNDGLSIRGSYEAEKSQLYLGFYQN